MDEPKRQGWPEKLAAWMRGLRRALTAVGVIVGLTTLPEDVSGMPEFLRALLSNPVWQGIAVALMILWAGPYTIERVRGLRRNAIPAPKPRRSGIFVTQRQAMYLIEHSEAFPRSARMTVDAEAREHEAWRLMLLFEKECPEAKVGSDFYMEIELEAWLADRASTRPGG